MTGFEASLDVGPVINRDFAGFVKSLAADEFLLAKMPSMANDIRQLAYYLYTCCEKHGDAANARAYNALLTS